MIRITQPRPLGRVYVVLAAGSALALVTACLNWAVGSPLAVLHRVGGSGNPEFEARLVDAAGLIAWACLCWFTLALSVEWATTLPGWRGRCCSAVARAISPRVVRRVAQALIGLTVLAGPLDAGAALAATAAPGPAVVSSSVAANSAASASDAYITTLDRPALRTASPPIQAEPATPNRSPAVDLDRPRPRFVPTSPVPASKVVSPTTATMLTGATHRESTDVVYVVRRGDALWDVAARHLGPQASDVEIAREWPRWYATNRAVIGGNPDLIRPGEILTAPGP